MSVNIAEKLPNIRSKGHRPSRCNSCAVTRQKHKRKIKAVKYKGGKCSVCDYNKAAETLCFHHIDPMTKEFNIAGNYNRKWETLKKELDKCILLCSNCHIEHYASVA